MPQAKKKRSRPIIKNTVVVPDTAPIVPYDNNTIMIPLNAEYGRIPDDLLEQFLSYKCDGDSDTKAARLSGIDMRAIQYWLMEDRRFANAYRDAIIQAVDTNEDRVQEQCRAGFVPALRMWLEAYRPERWGRKVVAENHQTLNVERQTINIEEERRKNIDEMPIIMLEEVVTDEDNSS